MRTSESRAPTSAAIELAEPGVGALLDPVGEAVRDASGRLGGTCLLESRDGRIVAHHVVDPPPRVVVDAVLASSSLPLQGASRRRVALGVVAGGAIQSVQIDGHRARVLVAPVTAAGRSLGWLWVFLPPAPAVELQLVSDAAAALGQAVCEVLVPIDEGLLSCLRGELAGRLPRALMSTAEQFWVAAVRGPADVPVSVVAGALWVAAGRQAAGEPSVAVAADDLSVYLVLSCRTPWAAAQIRDRVQLLLAASPGLPLRAGLSCAGAASEDLSGLRRQAELVLDVAGADGRCASLASDRAAVVLRLVDSCLDDLPDLGPDPLTALLDHDDRRRSEFAGALLAWLDAHGDVACAATRLGLHQNTLRYRLARAASVLGADLDDPAVRLEVHLRLRRVLNVPSRPPGR